jgi:hypothetical protein
MSLVSIAFLVSLDSLQVGLDAIDYLLGLSDKVWIKDRSLARLDPVQRCTTSMAIQSFKGCHSETLGNCCCKRTQPMTNTWALSQK